MRIGGIILGLLAIFSGLLVIWGTFYGGARLTREGMFHYLAIVTGLLMIIVIAPHYFILVFIPDLKIYEQGFVHPLLSTSYIRGRKELFIPFKDVKSIEMTTIPIGVKCLKIKTSSKTYKITKKN